MYYCHRVATQLQLTNISYHIVSYHIQYGSQLLVLVMLALPVPPSLCSHCSFSDLKCPNCSGPSRTPVFCDQPLRAKSQGKITLLALTRGSSTYTYTHTVQSTRTQCTSTVEVPAGPRVSKLIPLIFFSALRVDTRQKYP